VYRKSVLWELLFRGFLKNSLKLKASGYGKSLNCELLSTVEEKSTLWELLTRSYILCDLLVSGSKCFKISEIFWHREISTLK
jgi:hypothetical protein